MRSRRCGSALLACMCLALLVGCQQVPITGRKQLMLVSPREEVAMGEQAYRDILQKSRLSGNAQLTSVLRRVGQRIAVVANKPDYKWEFNLVQSDQVNAFALPGGKVAFYTGILPICRNEAGIAAVMGHEVAHALAHHGAERVSHGALVQTIGAGLGVALKSKDPKVRSSVLAAYGLGANVGVMLPYSRTHESEADRIGIELMAKAGYDPAEAPMLWDRMAELGGDRGPEFLSTHPNPDKRAAELRRVLPQMRQLYDAASRKYGRGITLASP